jgi:plastocyanin
MLKVLGVAVLGAVVGQAFSESREWPGALQGADTTITIRASGSTLEFTPTRVSAKAGTRVRLRFVNEGTLPHNVVVPQSDDDIDALVLAAYQAAETGYVPLGMKDKLVGWTALASPGESVEVTFVVPPAGEYTYLCLFPGHSNSMLGTLRALK